MHELARGREMSQIRTSISHCATVAGAQVWANRKNFSGLAMLTGWIWHWLFYGPKIRAKKGNCIKEFYRMNDGTLCLYQRASKLFASNHVQTGLCSCCSSNWCYRRCRGTERSSSAATCCWASQRRSLLTAHRQEEVTSLYLCFTDNTLFRGLPVLPSIVFKCVWLVCVWARSKFACCVLS